MVKVGLFGAGYLGKTHVDNWNKINGATLLGFYEPNDEIAKEITDAFPLTRFSSEDELIDTCDAVDIVLPTGQHFSICEKAIRKGKHVLVDKPIAQTVSEAQQLVKLVQESNIKLQVGHNERFNPALLTASTFQLNPLLIEAHRQEPFNSTNAAADVILDVMIHDIDAVLSLVNSDVKHISASGVGVVSKSPDIVNVRIEFYNGCAANLSASRIAKTRQQVIRLFQKDVHLEIDFLQQTVERFSVAKRENIPTDKIINLEETEECLLKTALQAFVNAITDNTRPVVNEIDGLRTLEVAHQIVQKIHQNLSLS